MVSLFKMMKEDTIMNMNMNMNNTYLINGYVSGVSKALNASDRLASISFKTDKETGIKRDSVSVSLPRLVAADISGSIELLAPSVIRMLEMVQNDILRDAVIAGASELKEEQVSISAIIARLAEEAKGTRVSRAVIDEWFDDVAASPISVAIASKLGITATTSETDGKYKVLADTLDTYKSKLGKLSAPSVSMSEEVITALNKALSLVTATVDDRVMGFLTGKLASMKDKPNAELLVL